jgi:hypothetical protein
MGTAQDIDFSPLLANPLVLPIAGSLPVQMDPADLLDSGNESDDGSASDVV